MQRTNIYDILPVRASLKPSDINKLTDYLVMNSQLFLSREDSNSLFSERSTSSTPISKLFNAFNENGVSNSFSLLAFPPRSNVHISEAVTHRHIVLDMTQMVAADPSIARRVLATTELNKKIISNVTQVVSNDGHYCHLKDQERFHTQIVRDCLSRSFYNSSDKSSWLRTSVTLSFTKAYALLLANSISRWFSLDRGSQDYITLVFAGYYLGQCSDKDFAEGILRTKHKEFYIREKDTVNLCLDKISEVLESGSPIPNNLDECFKAVMSIGIPRLFVNRQVLISKLRTIGEDLPTTAIALEYPPYFAWACLYAISGAKNQLNLFLKQQNLLKELQRAAGELMQAIPSLN